MKMVTAAAALLLMVRYSASSLSVATSLLSHPLRRHHHHHQRVASLNAFVAPASSDRWRGRSSRQESSSRWWSTAINDEKNKSNTDNDGGGYGGQYYRSISTTAIVQRRIDDAKRRREFRRQVVNNDRARNVKLRQLFHEESNYIKKNGTTRKGDDDVNHRRRQISNMFAVKVVACRTLREELKMTGREKRGRMFVERRLLSLDNNNNNNKRDDDVDDNNIDDAAANINDEYADHACTSMSGLRRTIHEFFRRLKKSSYLLSASLPTLDDEGNVLGGHSDDEEDAILSSKGGTWTLNSDDDVRRAFMRAEQYYLDNPIMIRPTLVIYVTKDPNATTNSTNTIPNYLMNMSDPLVSSTMTMLSFYSFPPGGIADPEATAEILRRLWRPFKALGRVYVANEGINAQMAVPTNVLSNFLQCCAIPSSSISSIEANVAGGGGDGSATTNVKVNGELSKVLGVHIENGINVDPIPVDTATFFTNDPPFRNLHVRVRAQIVADGRLDAPLNWQNAGYDMPPLEWHRTLKDARQAHERIASDDDSNNMSSSSTTQQLPIVLDCRNDYETQVGKFDLAEPLGTTNFRDSWDVLKDRLKDIPKDAPIMTYCTGGIRCVKVNAYLTQELQFTNVSRLAGGIVAYDRILREQAPEEEPMFKGVNFVFDGRLGRKITDDQLGTCYTCGEKTNMILNCKNDNCHRRMVQCVVCSGTFHSTCSDACKTRIVRMRYNRISGRVFAAEEDGVMEEEMNGGQIYSSLDDYSVSHSTELSPLFKQIESNTQRLLPTGAHMVSGPVQGSLLTTLASISRGGRVLEIGTFTGYATACFLLGAAQAGESLGVTSVGTRYCGPFVLSLERDRSALGVAMRHLNVMTKYGIGAVGAAKLCDIGLDVKESFTGDSVSFVYNDVAGCELLKVNDALATVEEMASCHPPEAAFDIVFIDADKTRLIDYVNALVGNDNVLKKGGLILVDNVLWKGLVLDAAASGNGYDSGSDSDEHSEDVESLKKNRRARKLANKMHRFNSAVVKDSRVNVLMMNMRDGLSVIRKR
jgi:predicted sulfurtransferase/predicted O-methyltransferase YrrM